jgi:putative RNA 2'-phosphotransferase
MLKECAQHGYFRAENCPVCQQPGRFLMNDRELDHLGRILTGVLRHFPEKYGLAVDEHGWIPLAQIVDAIGRQQRGYGHWLRIHHMVAIAESDPKGRYEVKGDMIRATYGHTVDIKLDLPTENIPEELFFPVTPEEAPLVLEVGLKPSDRKMVHLSRTAGDARSAGQVRTPVPVILVIDTSAARQAGAVIMQAGKTVFLVETIAPEHLRKLEEAGPAPAEDPASPG